MHDQRGRGDRARLGHRSTAIGGTLPREGAEQVEHAPAPCGDRVTSGEKLIVADDAGPLEGAEDDVIGIGRSSTDQKILALHGAAQRCQALAESRQSRITVLDYLLETCAEPLLARFAEIGLVLGPDMAVDIEDDKADQAGLEHGFGPILYEPGQRTSCLTAEKRGTIRVALFEILSDRRRIVHHLAAIDNDRHPAAIRLRQPCLFGKAPRHGLDLEPFVRERHARAPAEWAEAPVRLDAREIV